MEPGQEKALLTKGLLQGVQSILDLVQTGVNGRQISGWHVLAFAQGFQRLETAYGLLPVAQYG